MALKYFVDKTGQTPLLYINGSTKATLAGVIAADQAFESDVCGMPATATIYRATFRTNSERHILSGSFRRK